LSIADLPHYLLFAAVVFVFVAIALVDPLLIAMLAVPGVLLVQRVGGASLNLSGSDVLTVAGTAVALPLLRADMRTTRRLLWIALLFEAVLLLTVVAHPNEKSIFEWLHRLFLVGGSITIGAVLGRARRANAAVVTFLVLTTTLAVVAVGEALVHGFAPAQPFGLQKNFVGSMAASAVLIALVRPAWLRLSDNQVHSIAVLCAAGLLASRSRGAMLALAAALLVVAVRQKRLSSRSMIAVAVVTPLVIFTVVSLSHEAGQHQINSLTARADYSALAYREWHMSPVFGQGLRFFNQPGALLQSDAHNVIATTLAEGGVVGLVALALLVGLTLVALWRLPPEIGALALAFVAGRFIHGLFDIYWVAATTTLPWLIVGIVCGTADADAADQVSESPLTQRFRAAPLSRH
jgi:O-antigen ligase